MKRLLFILLFCGIGLGQGLRPNSVQGWHLNTSAKDTIKAVVSDTASALATSLQGAIGDSLDAQFRTLRLLLPDTVYLATGQEYNIYFDNVIVTPDYHDYKFDVVCDSGSQFSQGWRWTPTTGANGNHDFTLNIYNGVNELIETGSTVLKVATGGTIPSAKSILVIGNSLTSSNAYQAEVRTLAGSNLTCLGTQDTGTDSPNEGWTGKTFSWFESDSGSPFVDGLGADVSLQTYLTAQSYSDPDFVTIFLGINDIFGGVKTASDISTVLISADSLITNFIADAPSVKIGLCMITGGASQDGFGTNYTSGQTAWQYKNNQHLFNEQLKAKYGVGGTNETANVVLIPVYLGLDTEHNMSTTATAYNARNSTTYTKQTNGVHPAASGYYQIADYIFGWLANFTDSGFDTTIVPNGLFDANITGWTAMQVPATHEWVASGGGYTGALHIISDSQYDGAKCANLPVDGTSSYQLTCDLNIISNTTTLRVSCYNATDSYIGTTNYTTGITGTKSICDTISPTVANTTQIWILQTPPTGTFEAYIDNISLRKILP